MKLLLKNILRKKTIDIIKKINNNLFEIIIDIELSFIVINLIEYDKKSDSIFLHVFEEDDFDLVFDFDDLSEKDMFKIIKVLKSV